MFTKKSELAHFPHRKFKATSIFYTSHKMIGEGDKGHRCSDKQMYSVGNKLINHASSELPRWYCECNFCDTHGWIQVRGIQDMAYIKHNDDTSHIKRMLLVSYAEPIRPVILKSFTSIRLWDYYGYDVYFYNDAIDVFLDAVDNYQGFKHYDTTEIRRQINEQV